MIELSATITMIDSTGENISCEGLYYSDGRIRLEYNNEILMFDPTHNHSKHPTKLFIFDLKNPRWSEYNVKSIKLDIKK